MEWFRHNGGYLHESVEIRRQNHEDSTSPYGVFAKEDLPKGEIILKVPRSLYLQLNEEDITPEDAISLDASLEEQLEQEEQAMEVHYSNTCKLAKILKEEMDLYQHDPSSSRFAPFMRYLNETQPRGQIPATYSSHAKEILRQMQGLKTPEEMKGKRWFTGKFHFHPMVDWIDEGLVQKGCMDVDDADTYHAVALAIQRGYDSEFIPVWDMFNHDNFNINVASNSVHEEEEEFQAWTLDAVGKGQELFVSYNYCRHCLEDGTCDIWGLAGIFRDFGFVEGFPQQWSFPDQNVFALIEEHPHEAQDLATYEAHFFQHATFSPTEESMEYAPTPEAVHFFETQLNRLRHLNVQKKVKSLTAEHERYMITRYYHSLMNALETMIFASVSSWHDSAWEVSQQ